MTIDGEILKAIHETLTEARLPISAAGMVIEIGITGQSALPIAEEIFKRIHPFLSDRGSDPRRDGEPVQTGLPVFVPPALFNSKRVE